MNVATLSKDINATLQLMRDEFELAKRSMGIKPKLEDAKERMRNANVALHTAVELILQAQFFEVTTPPDVIERVNAFQAELANVYAEIDMCERIIATRAALRPANHLMN
jgi:hypothetical protein